MDGLSDDHKIEAQRDIYQRANDDLVDAGLEGIHLGFYLTSIYDHSIFEAFSKLLRLHNFGFSRLFGLLMLGLE